MDESACCAKGRSCSGILMVARLFIGAGCLLWMGIGMVSNWSEVSQFLNAYGLHVDLPFLWVAVPFLVITGILILLGFWIRTTCAVLFCASLPFLFFRLGFWGLGGFQAYVAQTFFMSTSALMGGFVLLMLTGPGQFAISAHESDWSKMAEFRAWGLLIARILIGGCLFVWSGVWTLFDWETNKAILQVSDIPAPGLVLSCMVAIELIGGLMILFGWRHRLAAWVLLFYWAATLVTVHRFWSIEGVSSYVINSGTVVQTFVEEIYSDDPILQMKYFMDGMGVIGSLLVLTTCISDRFGLERKRVTG